MAATACLYNLTRGELSKYLHPSLLSKGVSLTLYAMQNFPGEFQLQKNALLTLCSDRILQEVSFNRFMCAKLVLEALCHFEDINMDRMAVAICSILAAKVGFCCIFFFYVLLKFRLENFTTGHEIVFFWHSYYLLIFEMSDTSCN